MKVQQTDGYRDDYTADRRAEGLREDFDNLRSKINNDSSLSCAKKDQLLEKLDGYDKLLLEREDSIFGDADKQNDVGPANPQDAGFDRLNVIRREFNQAVDGFRQITEEFRTARADATTTTTASAEVSLEDGTLTASAAATSTAVADVVSTDISPPDCLQTETSTQSTESTDVADGSDVADDNDSIGSLEFDGMSVDDMLNGLNDDPQAVMDHIQGLDEEDKQMAMQMLQQRLQQINQMFSMLSNLAKTAHDTAKAAINNMRV